ncbi:uncharacterized protein LOC122363540 [Amphibalanus amphitrite]|uniref:uncharacterized protein LOC122363540 n=1 Tax=Amphibalanus amphitrite TaxID=1232801 RepID=UPI001C91CF6F|nr:uncharacterized protein LOC122363540 [Amphibalanus amphitrite]
MADLPASRFDMTKPFACVGLDFCGPLTVRKFRKTEKRYILLITCLATRALHLELVSSMDTDGFLMAFRRFVARRGRPRVVWSDNGSNLVAGEKELKVCLDEWNQEKIVDELSQRQIDWRFNPPNASHKGGVWERLVSSVKRALRVVLGNQCVSEEVLCTVLTEIEFVLNSRPLTYVSTDIGDPEPLTPNHFVLGYPEAAFPPGIFAESSPVPALPPPASSPLPSAVGPMAPAPPSSVSFRLASTAVGPLGPSDSSVVCRPVSSVSAAVCRLDSSVSSVV